MKNISRMLKRTVSNQNIRLNTLSTDSQEKEHVISEKRLKYPMKLEGGKWKRLSWDTAMGEISSKLQDIRKKHGPDSLMILGSAHHNNETAYALRKFAAFWGSNNIDHQARICPVSYTHLRVHETREELVSRLPLEKKKKKTMNSMRRS